MSRAPHRPRPRGRRSSWRRAALCLSLLTAAACPKEPPPPAPPAEPPPPSPQVADLGDQIFDAWFAARPAQATAIGDHRQDGRWPALGEADIAADLARIDDSLARLEAFDASGLGPSDRVDLDMLRNELLLQRFEHEVEKPWLRSPMWYAHLIGDGLEDLVSRDYAPVAERAQAVAERLEGLPALIDQAIANLQPGQTMQPQTQVAQRQLDGLMALLDELPARLPDAPAEALQRVEAATGPAREAVQRLHEHVDLLLPEANASWRLGKENFQRKLALTLQTELSADEVRRLAILEHAQVRARMAELADELADVLFPPSRKRAILRSSSADPETTIIAAVLEELSNDRVDPAQLRDRVETTLGRLDAFVREQGLVTLDDSEVLEVIWTPPHQRGVAIAGLAAPGPLDATKPGLPSFYLVQPVPDDWPQSYRDSFLREYNNFMIEILSIHEAIPGHFVQLYYGKREPSTIRRVLANGPFVEGWAVYAEHLMVQAGYSGGPPASASPPPGVSKRLWKVMTDPELRAKAIALHGLKFYLRTVTNALLDHSIHAGEMDELEALELMVFRSFQQEGEAKAKWVRAQVTSTQLSTYFVGAQAWFRLRKQAEAQDGFDLRAFHDEALRHGAPPVHRLPELMASPAADEAPDPSADEPGLDEEPAGEAPDEAELVEETDPDPSP
ncbi:MAG: DUF885 domain-containing protein [Myxococcales bacterium]|nr:DUF885 domain-containing protein [Myxococcales bacterium]MCB9712441.1 DUF885 domain-containing protein [Myxococcales bacterium]